uniref:Uncharacterized protein n=1 Tax=Strongyloides venezuelensis TaxID=75913 RepID=A0A0K0FW25_STRVS
MSYLISLFQKALNSQNVRELTGYLRIFDTKRLDEFFEAFEIATKIYFFEIPKLTKKDFQSFWTFFEKLSFFECFYIKHLCTPSMGPNMNLHSLLSLSSFSAIK